MNILNRKHSDVNPYTTTMVTKRYALQNHYDIKLTVWANPTATYCYLCKNKANLYCKIKWIVIIELSLSCFSSQGLNSYTCTHMWVIPTHSWILCPHETILRILRKMFMNFHATWFLKHRCTTSTQIYND